MIRGIVVCGWIGVVTLVAAAVQGYAVVDESHIEVHFVLGLFAAAVLLLSDLCLGIYLIGTGRVLRGESSTDRPDSSTVWSDADRHRRAAVLAGLALAALAVGCVFGVGPTVYTGEAVGTHHLLFFIALPVQAAALVVAGGEVRRGDAVLHRTDGTTS